MQIVEILGVSGHSPYDIIICDSTLTYCFTAYTNVVAIPPTLYVDVPPALIGVNSLIVKIIDSEGCEEIQLIQCPPTPTPTPTHTQTPTMTPTNANCLCIIFDNPTASSLNYSYVNCEGSYVSYQVNGFTLIKVCGKNPTYDEGMIVTIGGYCDSNICPTPTPTPTNTQTPTQTQTPTPTNTQTPTQTQTPSGALVIPLCSVLINSNTLPYVFYYNFLLDTTIPLSVPGAAVFNDIAHTATKLWLGGNNILKEWDITLSPFTVVFNRNITLPHIIGAGLGAIDNTTLITSYSSAPLTTSVVTLDVSSNPAISTFKFNMVSDRYTSGDILLTTTNKVIVTNFDSSFNQYISQYSYPGGSLEVDILISPIISNPWGVFQEGGEIYILNGVNTNNVFHIDKSPPYTITQVGNTGISNYGGSQVPSCITTHFDTL